MCLSVVRLQFNGTAASRQSLPSWGGSKLSGASVVALHEGVQSLLGFVMMDGEKEEMTVESAQTSAQDSVNSLAELMKSTLLSTPSPFKDSELNLSCGETNYRSCGDGSFVQVVSRKCLFVERRTQSTGCEEHQSAQDATQSCSSSRSSGSVGKSDENATIQQGKNELLALCICCILHALPTRLLSVSNCGAVTATLNSKSC